MALFTLKGIIGEVRSLSPEIRSKWVSPLSMAYHYKKHGHEFGINTSMQQYFKECADDLFQISNMNEKGYYTQNGVLERTYTKSFGKRAHIGFTFNIGGSEVRASLFTN